VIEEVAVGVKGTSSEHKERYSAVMSCAKLDQIPCLCTAVAAPWRNFLRSKAIRACHHHLTSSFSQHIWRWSGCCCIEKGFETMSLYEWTRRSINTQNYLAPKCYYKTKTSKHMHCTTCKLQWTRWLIPHTIMRDTNSDTSKHSTTHMSELAAVTVQFNNKSQGMMI
jgi:hypothetical protein